MSGFGEQEREHSEVVRASTDSSSEKASLSCPKCQDYKKVMEAAAVILLNWETKCNEVVRLRAELEKSVKSFEITGSTTELYQKLRLLLNKEGKE